MAEKKHAQRAHPKVSTWPLLFVLPPFSTERAALHIEASFACGSHVDCVKTLAGAPIISSPGSRLPIAARCVGFAEVAVAILAIGHDLLLSRARLLCMLPCSVDKTRALSAYSQVE